MTEDPANALVVIIGSAMGLAGFSGVVVMLSSSPESHKQADKFRVLNLLATSLAAWLIAYIAIGISYTEYSGETTWRLSSGIFFCIATSLSLLAYFVRRRLPDDQAPVISSFLWIILFGGTLVAIVVQLLNALAAIPGDRFLYFYFGLIWLLFVAAAQFVRTIFTRASWRSN